MESSKQHALMFLLGAVLVGGALGFTADRVIARDHVGVVTERETRPILTDLRLTTSGKKC